MSETAGTTDLVAELRAGCPELSAKCQFDRANAADEIERLSVGEVFTLPDLLERALLMAEMMEQEVIRTEAERDRYKAAMKAIHNMWAVEVEEWECMHVLADIQALAKRALEGEG